MVVGKLRIPWIEELEALLHELPTLDDANQAVVMTMAEAVEVSDMV